MAKESIEALVEGGKASAAPPLGPALGPLKVNIGQVIAEINKKTGAFVGMKVPVKVIVDTESKEFDIEVGTPPVSGLILKEINGKVGSGIPNKDKIGNLAMEDVIRIAKMKESSLSAKGMRSAAKSVIGSANSMGVLIEGKKAVDINPEIDNGQWDKVLNSEKLDVSKEKRSQLAEQLAAIQKMYAPELAAMAAAKKAKEEAKAAKAAAAAAGGATPAPGAAPAAAATPAPAAPAKK